MKSSLFLFLSLAFTFADDSYNFNDGNRNFTKALFKDRAFWSLSNKFISPFSIEAGLAILQSGAEGATGDEIRSGIFFPSFKNETESVIKNVSSTIQATTSNKFFIQNNFSIKEDYKSVLSDIYQTSLENVEFAGNTTQPLIEKWIQQQTDSKVSVGQNFSPILTKAMLINTQSLKINWSLPFSPDQTRKDRRFYGTSTDYLVPMLNQDPAVYNYYENTEINAKFLEVPLNGGDGDASLTIVLPNVKSELTKITEEQLEIALTTPEYVRETIQFSLPKWHGKIGTVELTAPLRKLGLEKVQDQNQADFSGINNLSRLHLSSVNQDNFLSFDENGIEAEVAQSVDMEFTSTKFFEVNRNFLFYIKVNGVIIFVGKMIEVV